jgi:hypothetical protein
MAAERAIAGELDEVFGIVGAEFGFVGGQCAWTDFISRR